MRKDTEPMIQELGRRHAMLIESIPHQPSGLHWCAQNSHLFDLVIQTLYEDLLQELGEVPNLAIVATGGYGRSELCPRSDVDLTVVPGDESSVDLDSVIRRLFQDIHFACCTVLRVDVGYEYRLISDTSGLDSKTRTGLLDMRLLSGSTEIFRRFQDELRTNLPAGEFILSKMTEREEAYDRYHDTPLVQEPQLKEGAGGLRDFHGASWIGEAIGERASRPTDAYDTILKYRNLLHFCAKKTHDTLTRTRQSEIAAITGSTEMRIVEEVAEAGSELFSGYRRAMEKLFEARFLVSPGVISVGGEVRLLPNSDLGSAAVGVAIATKLGLKVSDLPVKATNSYAGAAAVFALSKGEATIRNLDRCTLLDQLVPELTACRYLATDDGAHTYTVMEHSIRVIRNLDELGPQFLREIKSSIVDLEPLYFAALLHDVGKLNPLVNHSDEGAEITREVGTRWELAQELVETATWLVQEHLTMARFMRIRDIAHPSTIQEFAGLVGTQERLKYLTLLTWADISAVSAGACSPAQETFLRQLYESTYQHLQGETSDLPEVSVSRQRLLRELGKKPEEISKVGRFLYSLPSYYLSSTNAELVRLHLLLAERAKLGEITIEHFDRPEIGGTDLTICTSDSSGLLCQILGVLYAQDLSVLGIRACTTSDPEPIAIDVFSISFGDRVVPRATMTKTALLLRESLAGIRDVDNLISERGKDPKMRQHVYQWNYIPGVPGILEIRTPRGRGMAYRFSRLFRDLGWNIQAARVGQWAGTGTAAFYLTGPNHAQLELVDLARVMEQVMNPLVRV